MAPHSSTLAWKIPWTEVPGRLRSMGSLGVGHDWATSLSLLTFMHWRRKWQPTPVFLPGESQGRGQPGGLPSMGLHRVGRDWSDLAAAAAVGDVSSEAFAFKINFLKWAFRSLSQLTWALKFARHCCSHQIYNVINKEIINFHLCLLKYQFLTNHPVPLYIFALSSLIRIAHQLCTSPSWEGDSFACKTREKFIPRDEPRFLCSRVSFFHVLKENFKSSVSQSILLWCHHVLLACLYLC